jgi:penicillin-binding protein 2
MFRFRARVVVILILGGMLMVSTRLFYLQVVLGDHYRNYVDNVRIDELVTESSRGEIRARHGELLARNTSAYAVAFVPYALPERKALCSAVLRLYRLRLRERLLRIRRLDIAVHEVNGGYLVDFALAATFRRKRGSDLVERDEESRAQVVVPPKAADLVHRVAEVVDREPREMLKAFYKGLALVGRQWTRSTDPCVVAHNVEYLAAAHIRSNADRYPGVEVVPSLTRTYPYDDLACHVLGYMGRVSAEEYANWSGEYKGSVAKRFFPDDVIGRRGIERFYDREMRPSRGTQVVEVDAARRTQKILEETPAVPGATVYLTIDREVQQSLERTLKGLAGAGILMEPGTGKIIAMASMPGFNPNELPRPDPDPLEPYKPMLNRATQVARPLGSAFKLLMSVAALGEGKVYREVLCTGHYRGSRCRNHRVPMVVGLHDAIKRSCNTFFYRTGQELLGIEGIVKWGRAFGLGQPSGIDLPSDSEALLPTPEWKMRRVHDRWYPGDTRNISIGQGYLLVTPIQVAKMVAGIATGNVVRPRLVDRIVHADGTVERPKRDAPVDLGIARAHLLQVHRAMRGVCHEIGGTGRRAFEGWIEEQGYAIAGKTSTAVCTIRGQPDSNIGWFVGFAPVHDPRVAFVVALEHEAAQGNIHGGDVAAPVVRRVLSELPERYLEGIAGRERREQFRRGQEERP